ncbi:MAG: hypothetical protein HY050_07815 [Actinobacteria bacterium]|nr:hypothetical protein [Actinomycetota bacterium]
MRQKFYLLLLPLILSLSIPVMAQGVTPTIAVKPMSIISKLSGADQTYGMLVKGKIIYLFGNVTGVATTDGYLQAIDETGLIRWSLPLDSGQNEIATAATFDSAGNIWVLGSSEAPSAQTPTPTPTPTSTPTSTPLPTESASPLPTTSATPTPSLTPTSTPLATPTPIATSVAPTLNPDSVAVDPASAMRRDLTSVILWRVSRSGILLGTYTLEMKQPVLLRGAISTPAGIALTGIISTPTGVAGFYANSDLNGVIGKPLTIGKTDTELNALVKMSNGSVAIFGASSEPMAGTKLNGVRDGIISSVAVTGKLGKVIRSFNAASARSWQSATSKFFLGGDARTSGKMEAVITKFSSTFLPTWTARYPSATPALTAEGVTSHFAFFSPTAAIPKIKGWKAGNSLTLAYDSKGALTGAFGVGGMPISIGFSQELGLVVAIRAALGVSIFRALTR